MKQTLRSIAAVCVAVLVGGIVARCGSDSATTASVQQVDRAGRPFAQLMFLETDERRNLSNALSPAADIVPAAVLVREAIHEFALGIAAFVCHRNPVLTVSGPYAPFGKVCPVTGPTVFSSTVNGGQGALSTAILNWAENSVYPELDASVLPDVLRIDTTGALNTMKYSGGVPGALLCLPANGLLCGGRRFGDPAAEVTLSLLFSGGLSGFTDGTTTSYTSTGGFPYLEAPL